MIITTQMIKTNQFLPVEWSLSTGKIQEKLISSHHWSDMSIVTHKAKINRINIVRARLLLSLPKKVKEPLRTRLSGNKITWAETFVRSKKFDKWKTTLNRENFACYENLPIKTHLKKTILQITQKMLKTDTCHWLESITVFLWFLKLFIFRETVTHLRNILSSQRWRFQFSSPILDGLCVSFNAHHFFMWKQFMCVDCYISRLTFSNT